MLAANPVQARLVTSAALAVPVLAGLAYLAAFGAPPGFIATNLSVLAMGIGWIAFAPPMKSLRLRRWIIAALVVLLFAPLVTGPAMVGVARWVPVGPFLLHVGMLAAPAIAAHAALDRDYAAPLLLLAVFAAFLQPDAATGLALTFAAVGLHDVTRDWKVGVAAIIGFFASLIMAMRGELPPQPFVERVFAGLLGTAPLAAAGLFAALLAGFLLILFALPAPRAVRFALAGSLFGFTLTALVSHYPTPLVGYGAAPILGYALALGMNRVSAASAAD